MSQNAELQRIKSFTIPKLHTGKEWYVDFFAFDPVSNRMQRKKIKLNSIASIRQRRVYAADLIARLISQLRTGWNPWIESEGGKAYTTFSDACDAYRNLIDRYVRDGYIRPDTYVGYMSYLRNLIDYNSSLRLPITYIYQLDRAYLSEFLDYIYIDRQNKAQTRDNYLTWLRLFSSFLVSRAYLKTKPTDGIDSFGSRGRRRKNRSNIPADVLANIGEWLHDHNRHYLLACYMIYYCFIRPKELTYIQIGDIRLYKKLIILHSHGTKNRKDAQITLPDRVAQLMIDIGIFAHPSNHYLFSRNFMPGADRIADKNFRDYWHRDVRSALHLPVEYKLYSLKDTGVTDMLKGQVDTISVRDQARHSSVLITDLYTPHDVADANSLIAGFKGKF